MAMMSILGLYEYDSTIFDNLALPTASDITDEALKVSNPFIPSKSDLIAYLCMQLAELSIVYPNAPVMRQMIGIWSNVRLPVWCALYNTMLYKYNPIWNKDGTITENHNLTIEDDYNVTNMETAHSGNVTNEVSAYDQSAAYSPRDKQTLDTADTQNGNTNNVHTDKGSITRTEQGNIGVTTTQAMIKEQRDAVRFSLYDEIVADFKQQFCIALY